MERQILVIPSMFNEPKPALAIAVPASPPIRAWDELDGSPQYQVAKPHVIAPMRVAKIRLVSTMLGSITPLPIVDAILSSKNKKAMKLKKAAQRTAQCGFNT